jgi:hypothetical protein
MKKILILCVLAACSSEDNLGNTVEGTANWALALGGRGYETGNSVAIDSQGDVVVAGTGYLSTIDFGDGPVGNDGDWAFLSKRSGADGSPIWTLALVGVEAKATIDISEIAIGRDDSIYVTGGYMGTVHFGAQTFTTPVSVNGDLFLAKYGADGSLVWARSLGSASDARGTSLALDANDTVFVGAVFNLGTFDFLGETHSETANNVTTFFLSYGSDGEPRSARFLDPSAYMYGLAVSPTGDVITVGALSAPAMFDGEWLVPNANSRGFVARYHGDGSYLWSRTLGIANPDGQSSLNSAAITSDDRIAICGTQQISSFSEAITLDVLDATGAEQWNFTNSLEASYYPPKPAILQDGTIASPFWFDDLRQQNPPGYLELSAFDRSGSRSAVDIGNRLTIGGRQTAVRSAAVGPHGEIAVTGVLGGEVVIGGGAIATHGTNDSDALVVLLPPR